MELDKRQMLLTALLIGMIINLFTVSDASVTESQTYATTFGMTITIMSVIIYVLATTKDEPLSYATIGIVCMVIVGGFMSNIYSKYVKKTAIFKTTSDAMSSSVIVNTIEFGLLIGIIAFGLSFLNNYLEVYSSNKATWGSFLLYFLFYIPCLLEDLVKFVKNEFQMTSSVSFLLLGIEFVLIAAYMILPKLLAKQMMTKGTSILNDPIFLSQPITAKIGKADNGSNNWKRTNCAFSMWSYVNPQENTGLAANIFSYGDYPQLQYVKNSTQMDPVDHRLSKITLVSVQESVTNTIYKVSKSTDRITQFQKMMFSSTVEPGKNTLVPTGSIIDWEDGMKKDGIIVALNEMMNDTLYPKQCNSNSQSMSSAFDPWYDNGTLKWRQMEVITPQTSIMEVMKWNGNSNTKRIYNIPPGQYTGPTLVNWLNDHKGFDNKKKYEFTYNVSAKRIELLKKNHNHPSVKISGNAASTLGFVSGRRLYFSGGKARFPKEPTLTINSSTKKCPLFASDASFNITTNNGTVNSYDISANTPFMTIEIDVDSERSKIQLKYGDTIPENAMTNISTDISKPLFTINIVNDPCNVLFNPTTTVTTVYKQNGSFVNDGELVMELTVAFLKSTNDSLKSQLAVNSVTRYVYAKRSGIIKNIVSNGQNIVNEDLLFTVEPVRGDVYKATVGPNLAYDITMPSQRWNNVVFNYNSDATIDVFTNGVLARTFTDADGAIRNQNTNQQRPEIILGAKHGLYGAICNVNYYKNPLTKSQIATQYNLLSGRNPPINNVI